MHEGSILYFKYAWGGRADEFRVCTNQGQKGACIVTHDPGLKRPGIRHYNPERMSQVFALMGTDIKLPFAVPPADAPVRDAGRSLRGGDPVAPSFARRSRGSSPAHSGSHRLGRMAIEDRSSERIGTQDGSAASVAAGEARSLSGCAGIGPQGTHSGIRSARAGTVQMLSLIHI